MLKEYRKIQEELKKLAEKDLGMTYEEYKEKKEIERKKNQKERLEEKKKYTI